MDGREVVGDEDSDEERDDETDDEIMVAIDLNEVDVSFFWPKLC
jgi:hypothetical protein